MQSARRVDVASAQSKAICVTFRVRAKPDERTYLKLAQPNFAELLPFDGLASRCPKVNRNGHQNKLAVLSQLPTHLRGLLTVSVKLDCRN